MALSIVGCSKIKIYQDYLERKSPDKCSGIVDIYYNKARSPDYVKALETSFRGRKYVTLTACDNCVTAYVERSHYDTWAESYKKQGIEPPHPRRTDTTGLICHLYGGKIYRFSGYNYIYPPVE